MGSQKANWQMNRIYSVLLGGTLTTMHIWSKSVQNPVLLFVHGGPGSPNRHHIANKLLPLSNRFTLVGYDERGCGDSRIPTTLPLRIEDLANQLRGVILYVKSLFPSAPLFVVGESFGSALSLITLSTHSLPVDAYIGYGQVAERRPLEIQKGMLFLEELMKRGKTKDFEFWKKKLTSPSFPSSKAETNRYLAAYYDLLEKKDIPSFYEREILPYQNSHEFSKKAKRNQGRDNAVGRNVLFHSLPDSFDPYLRLPMPVHILAGEWDIVVPPSYQKSVYDRIEAPSKTMTIAKEAGHVVPFDNPKVFEDFLLNLVIGCRETKKLS